MSLLQYIDHSDLQPAATLHDKYPTVRLVHSNEFRPVPGRQEKRFDNLGRNNYVDHETGRTPLDRPSFNLDAEQQAEASYHYSNYRLVGDAPSDGDSSTQVPQSPSLVSPVSPVAAQQQAASPNPSRSLPPGWQERRTHEGRVYSFDCMSNLDICLGAGKMKPMLIVLS